ncbi:MAG: glycosyltransferase family protein [Candidatus Scalindua rubra]|uniref:dolichyl-phosphate beta-glucosyltransferase n=1 Tax=Candidatus Scalindua rubra TaxID=1872076 RepID=A0A1E3X7T5_9BACT|nr:MAG: glycosyltransferase family protein [Candidatus Scalindua rubra]
MFTKNVISDVNKEDIYLSIVIPAYNEEKRIGNTLGEIISYLKTKDYKSEIILVSDGSTDSTINVVIRESGEMGYDIKITENEISKGKGYSVRRGMLETRGEYVLFTDADLSTPIDEVEKLIYWLGKGYDVTIGSRGLEDSQVEIHQSFVRESMGKIFNKIMNLIVFTGFKDTQCGFKCFKRDAVNKIFKKQRIRGYTFDVEILLIAKRQGFRVREVPVRWLNSPHSKVRIIRDPIFMLYDIFRIRFYDFSRRYSQ